MRRAVYLAGLAAIAVVVSAPAGYANHLPAYPVSPSACNDGTERAFAVSSANANSPHDDVTMGGCHIHRP